MALVACPGPTFAPTPRAEYAPMSRTGSQTPAKLASASCPSPLVTGESDTQKEKGVGQNPCGRAWTRSLDQDPGLL